MKSGSKIKCKESEEIKSYAVMLLLAVIGTISGIIFSFQGGSQLDTLFRFVIPPFLIGAAANYIKGKLGDVILLSIIYSASFSFTEHLIYAVLEHVDIVTFILIITSSVLTMMILLIYIFLASSGMYYVISCIMKLAQKIYGVEKSTK